MVQFQLLVHCLLEGGTTSLMEFLELPTHRTLHLEAVSFQPIQLQQRERDIRNPIENTLFNSSP